MTARSGAGRLALLENEVESLRAEVKELRADIKSLVEAWNAATSLVKFIKLLATIAAAVTAIYVFATHGFTSKPG